MTKRRPAAKPAAPTIPLAWEKWTTQLPQQTLVLLKVRAAQEQRNIRETLRDAIEAYVRSEVLR